MAKRKSGATREKINSRQKGAGGEREFANLLKTYGLEARRGQQFSGGKDSPDVVCSSLTNVHFEVKRVEAGNPYVWFEQAIRDGVGKMPIVAHRKNGKQWLAVIDMHDLLDMLIRREGDML